MSVSKKELVNECAELRVENSEQKKVIKDFHTMLDHIESDSMSKYESTEDIRDYTRSSHFKSAKVLLESSLNIIGSEIVTFSQEIVNENHVRIKNP